MTVAQERPPARRERGFAPWLAAHAVDIVFVLLVVVAFAYTVHLTHQSFYYADDWRLITQAQSLGGLFKPYNDHFSFIILATYRLLFELFGFGYTAARVVGFAALFAVPLAYFFTTRRQFGAPLAALLALPLVWYGRYIQLFPGAFNHYLALLGGVVCAAALNRDRGADWVLAAGLVFALSSAGGGVAVAAACVVHNICTRPHVRRWLAIAIPSLLWFTWWLIEQRRLKSPGPYHLSASQTVRFMRDLGYAPFSDVALGASVVAVILLCAYIAYGVWRVSKGLRPGANFLAWSVAVLVWGYGVANQRGLLADPTVFRYRYVALGFALLAVVPRRPMAWPAHFPIATDRRWLLAAALVLLLIGSARALSVRDDMKKSAVGFGNIGRVTRGDALLVGLGPSVVPNNFKLPFALGAIRGDQFRALLSRYGTADPSTSEAVDQQLVSLNLATAHRAGTSHAQCTALDEALQLSAGASECAGRRLAQRLLQHRVPTVRRSLGDDCARQTRRPVPPGPADPRCTAAVPDSSDRGMPDRRTTLSTTVRVRSVHVRGTTPTTARTIADRRRVT